MTVVLIVGGLAFAVGLLVLRPFPAARGDGPAQAQAQDPDDVRRRELLRQLRDLDDDLAAGKLTEDDHIRLRGPIEYEAAAVLNHKRQGPPTGTGTLAPARRAGSCAQPPADQGPPAPHRWRRRAAVLLSLAGASAVAVALLMNAVSARSPGQNITGNPAPGGTPAGSQAAALTPAASAAAPATGAPAPVASTPAPAASTPASPSGQKQPTRQQLAAVAAAEAQVKQNPKDVSVHLALAGAYAAAGASQLAAVEYLTVTQLDPANPGAGTALALLAFEVGRPGQAKTMIDRVLTADPKYPEALYVRGLVDLMGLRKVKAAERDFNAYLAVAPLGAHRAAAATLLALAESQGQPGQGQPGQGQPGQGQPGQGQR
ncbi:MAG: hypothetical protein ABJB47_00445 [Actinomycetota bacterium]